MADAPQEVDDMERLASVQAHEEVEQEHAGAGAGGQQRSQQEIEDDENETCGFCRFMKGGGCRQAFISWSKCVDGERDSGNEDFAEACKDVTLALHHCMMDHRDYYGPLLEEEEQIMEEEQRKKEEEAAAAAAEQAGQKQQAEQAQAGAAAAVQAKP